ncbi:hypothetical protein SMICM17S_04998 [Streptomyces microflavus]
MPRPAKTSLATQEAYNQLKAELEHLSGPAPEIAVKIARP